MHIMFPLIVMISIFASSLSARELVVATKKVPPFSMRDDQGHWYGLSVNLWKEVAASQGLRFRFVEQEFEESLSNLERGAIDIALGALNVSSEREKVFDFSMPYHAAGQGILIMRSEGIPWLTLIKRIFSIQFWQAILALVGVLFLAGALVWVFERRANPEQFGGNVLSGLGSGLWWSAVTMTTVGYGDKAPAPLGGRIVGFIWMFMSLIIFSGFIGTIASTFTEIARYEAINSVEDLKNFKVGVIRNSVGENFLNKRNIRSSIKHESLDQAIDDLINGRVKAVVYDAAVLNYHMHHTYSDKALTIIDAEYDIRDYAFGLRNNLPERDVINQGILQFIHSGQWQTDLAHYFGSPSEGV